MDHLDGCPECEHCQCAILVALRRCDEPDCSKEATTGWPIRPGGTGPNGGYRRTCSRHYIDNLVVTWSKDD